MHAINERLHAVPQTSGKHTRLIAIPRRPGVLLSAYLVKEGIKDRKANHPLLATPIHPAFKSRRFEKNRDNPLFQFRFTT